MNLKTAKFLADHRNLTRRYFLRCGAAGAAAMCALPMMAKGDEQDPALQKALAGLETWLTRQDDFRDVSRTRRCWRRGGPAGSTRG